MPNDRDFVSNLQAEMVRVISQEVGAPMTFANEVAQVVAQNVSAQYSGEQVYIRSKRYDPAEVVRDFNYRNHQEVCAKHGISQSTLWRIMRRQVRVVSKN